MHTSHIRIQQEDLWILAREVRHDVDVRFDLVQLDHPEMTSFLKSNKPGAEQVVVPLQMGSLEGANQSLRNTCTGEQKQDLPIDHPLGSLDVNTRPEVSSAKLTGQHALTIFQPGAHMDPGMGKWSHGLLKGLALLDIRKKLVLPEWKGGEVTTERAGK